MPCLNCIKQEWKKKHNLQCVFLAHLRLFCQSQGHQAWHELVDPKQGHNQARVEGPRLNIIQEKPNIKIFDELGNTIISLEYMQKSKIVASS